jgi:menaquinone-9 beta-reductase
VESGLMAAATILAAGGNYSNGQLLPYTNRLVTRFGAAPSAGVVGPGLLRNFFAGMLLGNRWFTRHVVLDRWFLHNHQAAMQTT